MKKEINKYEFIDAFRRCGRVDSFSYEGFEALFDYLERMEADTGEEALLDVIAIDCEFDEWNYEELAGHYSEARDILKRYKIGEIDEEEFELLIKEFVSENGVFIEVDEDKFICSSF